MTTVFAEYIWIDGGKPTSKLRSKTKVLPNTMITGRDKEGRPLLSGIEVLPDWSFDGSSTGQSQGGASDCALKPVLVVLDPLREHSVLVLCEVFNMDGTPHPSNTRSKLRRVLGRDSLTRRLGEELPERLHCWFGFEQEYTLFKGSSPLGFGNDRRYPPAQGPYYCGVGADEVRGRPLAEDHMKACARAGLKISGINAEVMPGQWEFQIGPAGPIESGDHLWISRWLLHRIGEQYGITATFDPKPVTGDWNGAGLHTNFSTPQMREDPQEHDTEPRGIYAIEKFCKRAGEHISEHLEVYGEGIEIRLTGKHETCSLQEFKWGVLDRTASIRIPLPTIQNQAGYLEDRRPNANADPYEVASVMMKTAYNLWDVREGSQSTSLR